MCTGIYYKNFIVQRDPIILLQHESVSFVAEQSMKVTSRKLRNFNDNNCVLESSYCRMLVQTECFMSQTLSFSKLIVHAVLPVSSIFDPASSFWIRRALQRGWGWHRGGDAKCLSPSIAKSRRLYCGFKIKFAY